MGRPYLVHQLLIASADRSPDAPALVEPSSKGARSWSYAELAAASARVAAALGAVGTSAGERVGLWTEKTAWAVAALYGILRTGCAYVPVDPAVPTARAALILSRIEARAIVTTADRVATLLQLKRAGELPSLQALVVLGPAPADQVASDVQLIDATACDERAPDPAITDGYLAYVLHTSGSTGVPKGVAISHANALAFVEPATSYFGIGASDRLACHAPLHFDLSVFDLYCAALVGAPVVLFPEFFSAFPKKMVQAAQEQQVTIWNSVVSALALLLDKGFAATDVGPRLPSLRAIVFSGERMPIPLLRRLRERFPGAGLFNVYGQTEANSSLVHPVLEIPSDDAASLPLGRALPNFEVFVVDEAGAVQAPAGASGELCVRARTVASGGYFRAPELSREKFVPDPAYPDSGMRVYRTGDLVRTDERGELFFAGRRDNMVKTRGYRVELSEVEVAIEAAPGVGEVAVVAVASPSIGHELWAFIQPAPGCSVERAALEALLRSRLPAYMVPERIEVRADLPRTSTGKIDRKTLASEPR